QTEIPLALHDRLLADNEEEVPAITANVTLAVLSVMIFSYSLRPGGRLLDV
ncbi:hypothetical protein BgiMline_010078, partial [Biomphalaria glabrata]